MAQKRPKTRSPSEEVILRTVREYRKEASDARKSRMKRNRLNWDMYYGNQDWSHKQEGQSTEFLPKMSGAAEQMSAFVKRALVQFGDWFSMELPQGSFLAPEQARAMLRLFLENMAVSRTHTGSFYTLVSDAVKQGLMESLIILKVHGQHMPTRSWRTEPGDRILGIPDSLTSDDATVWRLRIDLIPSEDYYPDPTGRHLYEIHSVERDYFDVLESAEQGLYDKSVVEKITEDFQREDEDKRKARHKGQDETTPIRNRRRVVIDECWGTLLGPDGRPVATDVVVAIANNRHVIRPPENIREVFWHGESPIVSAPVIRVPHSVHHKALYDDASGLNVAINELYNLILDGGIGSVWGVRQVHANWLADPRQISNGIPANATLVLNDAAPMDGKVVETVTTGKVPPEAITVLNLADREFQAAVKTNDTRLGFLPPRAVKATELVQAEQSGAVVIDGFAADLETEIMVPVLRKAWMCLCQFVDDIPSDDVVKAIGTSNAFKLSQMSAAQRFAALSHGLGFKVSGLTNTLSKARDFQRIMALMQGIASTPPLLEAFIRRMSADKTLDTLMRALNINPESLQMTEDEQKEMPAKLARMAMLQQMMPPGGGSPPNSDGGGDAMSGMRSEINQNAEPTQGF